MENGNPKSCPFTSGECDGGTIYADGTIGCGFKETSDSECEWTAELPENVSPRDFYNAALMEVV